MNKVFLTFALLLAVLGVNAQNAVGKWSITPKVGFNIASMTNTDGSDPRWGLAVGAEAEYQATDVLGISFGALYSQQGLKASGYFDTGYPDVDAVQADATLKMDYINIPILANFYVVKGLALKVGLQPGFKVNGKVKEKVGGASAEVDLKDALDASESDGDVKSVDLAIPVGLSYEYKNIKFDARYNWSVTNAISVDGENSKHSVFQITLGYSFKL